MLVNVILTNGRLQTTITNKECLLTLHIKRASATGTFCNLACRRRTWKDDKAL